VEYIVVALKGKNTLAEAITEDMVKIMKVEKKKDVVVIFSGIPW
jgi:phenylpyruvate tautomerase PptA (4-oxalocrotonate tautomerase family)